MCSVQFGEHGFNIRHFDEMARHTMHPTLDEADRQLLSLLQTNARESTATLARQLGLARTTVVSRIARLEREGVVAGYGVRLGTRMDQATVRAWCSLSVLPQSAPRAARPGRHARGGRGVGRERAV
jgi:DNA-binding Lrp family transcriptional regulator